MTETDVHVLVHDRPKASKSSVHDHGPCWVISGNYKNPTGMRRWRRLDDGSKPGYAQVELQKESLNEPGQAAVFAKGDIASIELGDDTPWHWGKQIDPVPAFLDSAPRDGLA